MGRRKLRTVSECRDYGHRWKPVDGGKEGKGWWRKLTCDICGTNRTDHLSSDGDPKNKSYSYLEGYLLKGGALTTGERGLLRIHHIKEGAKEDG